MDNDKFWAYTLIEKDEDLHIDDAEDWVLTNDLGEEFTSKEDAIQDAIDNREGTEEDVDSYVREYCYIPFIVDLDTYPKEDLYDVLDDLHRESCAVAGDNALIVGDIYEIPRENIETLVSKLNSTLNAWIKENKELPKIIKFTGEPEKV